MNSKEPATDSEVVHATCFRCYVWGEHLDFDQISDALSDALTSTGHGNTEGGNLRSVIAVIPETLPLDTEQTFLDSLGDLGAKVVILPRNE